MSLQLQRNQRDYLMDPEVEKSTDKTSPVKLEEQPLGDAPPAPVLDSKKTKKAKKCQPSSKENKVSPNFHWSLTQQLRYVRFLERNSFLFELSLHDRKEYKIHQKISQYVKTRTPEQCRSHHQKMLLKYASIEKIIHMFSELYPETHGPKVVEQIEVANSRGQEKVGRKERIRKRQENPRGREHLQLRDDTQMNAIKKEGEEINQKLFKQEQNLQVLQQEPFESNSGYIFYFSYDPHP